MEFRHSYVEEISKESWLMRDLLVPTKNYRRPFFHLWHTDR